MKTSIILAIGAASLAPSVAFTAPMAASAPRYASTSSLSMSKSSNDDNNNVKTFAVSALAAACLLTGVVSADAAFALDGPYSGPQALDSSSMVVAGRSGGRAGGRSAPRMRAAPPRSSGTRVINRTTIVAPPVMIGSPYGYGRGGYGGGFGGGYYDPTPGIALNLGLNAISGIANGNREYRQTEELARDRAELSSSREREMEMQERIRALERMQMEQGKGGAASPQVIYQQMPPVQMAPSAQVAAPVQ